MPLTGYGLREWLTITLVAAAAGAAFVVLGWWWPLAIIIVLWLALMSFFRDPIRRLPRDLPAGAMLAPSDGTISAVLQVDEHEATGGSATVVRIFMSVLNVHVNRSPCDGRVIKFNYTPGKFLNATTEESSSVNENNLITMRIANEETIGVRQISGMIARRIVCKKEVGDDLKQAQKFGMIKFGSTTELILPRPEAVDVLVKKGDKVRGGLTVLATLAPKQGT